MLSMMATLTWPFCPFCDILLYLIYPVCLLGIVHCSTLHYNVNLPASQSTNHSGSEINL
uniref:Uncharacterized protein n=1 Tax=Anguilla anguilla TaxID=7936 RepID=A0A0E9WGQ2_ANGAN